MIKEKSLKRIALLMALVFVNQIFFPSTLFALTGGPGQPELESFAPFNSTDLVDPFSGDFKYNIPLLNVPGPNGGYPINISYSGDISVDQEAGWVGMGWSLNPGAINRQLRGLPDDFDGNQKVERKRKMLPNRTYSIGMGAAFAEIFGFDLSIISEDLQLGGNLNLNMNNYSGFSLGLGLGFSKKESSAADGARSTKEFNSDKAKTTTQKSYALKTDELLSDEKEVSKFEKRAKAVGKRLQRGVKNSLKKVPAGAFLVGSGNSLSSIDFPRTSSSLTLESKLGLAITGLTADLEFRIFYSQQDYTHTSQTYPAYGYMHSETGSKNDKAILDYYTDKTSVLNPSSAFLPIPILTNDVFSVTGQGVGGVYRSQLGTIPLLATPTVKSASDSRGFGFDMSLSNTDIKIGINPKGSYTDSRSGRWTSGDAMVSYFRQNLGLTAEQSSTFEQNAFIKMGDLTDNEWHKENLLKTSEPLRLDMDREFQGAAWKPTIKSHVYPRRGGSFLIGKSDRIKEKRSSRKNLFKHYTNAELVNMGGPMALGYKVFDPDPVVVEKATIEPKSAYGSLIHRVEVENGGTNYVYGIPVYTHEKIDRTFSVKDASNPFFDPVTATGIINYGSGDDNTGNEKGRAALFNENKVGRFAHAYLLTEVLSDDYVDVSGDGVSADDFGSYTQFKYYQAYTDFKSRSPAANPTYKSRANLMMGAGSDNEDDMASYAQSRKDIYYLYRIETKTHFAEFTLEKRGDDYGYLPFFPEQELYKLKEITLYKKTGPNPADKKEIKSVEFEYMDEVAFPQLNGDTELMKKAPLTRTVGTTQKGKLTLKSIRFTFEGQETNTSLNPYEFMYHDHFDYEDGGSDKWGNYQGSAHNDFGSNFLFPYTAQNRDLNKDGAENDLDANLREDIASNWLLKSITLPTGGEIVIEHESDDYAYVQNRRAQTMYQIAGVGGIYDASDSETSGYLDLNDDKIFFKLKESVAPGNILPVLQDMKRNVKNVYFKTLIRLKKRPNKYNVHGQFLEGGDFMEYIEGYLELDDISADQSCINQTTLLYDHAYIKVNKTKLRNAMRMAAVQHMRLNGQYYNPSFSVDFSGPNDEGSLMGIATSIIKGAIDDKAQNQDFINAAFTGKKYGERMSMKSPSVIRLNAQNGLKYGGGARVKSITVKDNWDDLHGSETTFNTRQTFSYTLEDGTTSGVAEYEPLHGGEENPFRQPHYYSDEKGILNSNDILFELPATEALFPSPKVGYSRVVMETVPVETNGIPINEYKLSSNGIVVQEFYTAKEYPVFTSATKVQKVNQSQVLKFLKWMGGQSFFHPGFSQGYYTELNDMHGKMKKTSTYSTSLGLSEPAFQTVSYFYKTEGGTYNESGINRISNDVEVLLDDGVIENRTVGEVAEAYIEMVEDETQTIGGDIKMNIDNLVFGFIPIPVPTAMPDIDYNFSMRRTAVMNKMVTKTAILEKVLTQQEGRTTYANNLLYDYESGAPLLTQVMNDYDAPIYSYNRPEHWLNPEFKGPWRNWKAKVDGATWKGIIQNGDVIVEDGGETYWVHDAETGVLETAFGSTYTIQPEWPGGTIMQSGYSGKLTTMSSQIVSLFDPSSADNKDFVLFEKYNNKGTWVNGVQDDLNSGLLTGATQFYRCDSDPLYDCSKPNDNIQFCPDIQTEQNNLIFTKPGVSGNAIITFPVAYTSRIGDFMLKKVGKRVHATLGTTTLILDWSDPDNLFLECLPGVLNAGATLFADGDGYREYEVLNTTPYAGITLAEVTTQKPVRYKHKHLYRPVQSLKSISTRTYTDEIATDGFYETKMQEDGSYTAYVDYNFTASVDKNKQWLNTGEITKYDPFGNQLENRDALGIYSCELFNEDRTLVTANAINAAYDEIGYQNFEGFSGAWPGLRGHINFSSGASINSSLSHTGDQSLNVNSSSNLNLTDLLKDKLYRLSFWQQSGTPLVTTSVADEYVTKDASNIDGWDLITYTFKTDKSSTSRSISFNGNGVIDDIRFYPADAAITTYVYDLDTYRLIAQMDANNFTTFYGYNEEGKLAYVKKETDRGIHTVSNNIVHLKK